MPESTSRTLLTRREALFLSATAGYGLSFSTKEKHSYKIMRGETKDLLAINPLPPLDTAATMEPEGSDAQSNPEATKETVASEHPRPSRSQILEG
jgi:hypothetical protein